MLVLIQGIVTFLVFPVNTLTSSADELLLSSLLLLFKGYMLLRSSNPETQLPAEEVAVFTGETTDGNLLYQDRRWFMKLNKPRAVTFSSAGV